MVFTAVLTLPQVAVAQHKPGPLSHTYSIVARDPVTGDIGVAVQSHAFLVGAIVSWGEAGIGVKAISAAGHFVGTQYSVQANLMGSDKVWSAMAMATSLRRATWPTGYSLHWTPRKPRAAIPDDPALRKRLEALLPKH